MTKFHPRRFITNFVDGTAEFHDDATPPAEEYISLREHEALMRDADDVCPACGEKHAWTRSNEEGLSCANIEADSQQETSKKD